MHIRLPQEVPLPVRSVLLMILTAGLTGCHAGNAETKRLRTACESGDARACDSLGGRLRRGEYVLRDEARAARLFEGAGEAGVGESCASLGTMLQDSSGGARDSARGIALLQ